MAAFRCPPERLLRPLARAATARTSQPLMPALCRTSTRMYRAAVCKELGKPLVVEDFPVVQKLRDSQVRVAVHSCGINFADILMCMGKYQEKPELPFVPGSEIAGEVIDIGDNVTMVTKGDHVLGVTSLGGWSKEVTVQQEALWKIPSSLSFDKAAALPVSYGTAYVGLTRKANVKPGQTVLVTAAAGALGLATVDIAVNALGAKAIGAASADKLTIVGNFGAMATIDYRTESIKDKVKKLTGGRGANVILDAVGGDVFKECLKCIAWDGTIIPAGFASGNIPQIPANILLVKNCNVAGLYWGAHSKFNPSVFRDSVDKALELCSQGKLKGPHVSATFNMDKVNEAIQFLLQKKSTGKVVIKIR
ncbi:quinone oxidoreductase-like protein 2 homolog [Actinia tenebrosa]|uniref:Quinone oxidoreductase-like protein 2 homolog n=1 Tax=Actinia tenebrosa TaxID=6105 RepID=A0A6P8HU21_ACTTE|nr:quinone oxidoreductase-like protein 2 homolog [Actinia tenebrosa]